LNLLAGSSSNGFDFFFGKSSSTASYSLTVSYYFGAAYFLGTGALYSFFTGSYFSSFLNLI